MPDITPFLQLGAVGVVCYLLVWMVQRLLPVIENNTAVMTQIKQYMCEDKTELQTHDERAQRIEVGVNRIEQKIDRHLEARHAERG